jgi:hypothetical protein
MSERDRDERRRLEALLRQEIAAAETDGPTMAEVGAYVDGSMEPEDRLAFEELLALDPALRAEVSDLRELQGALRHEGRRYPRWPVWTGLAAAAAVAAVLLWPPAPAVVRPGTPASPPAPILTLRDTGGEITLRADGSLDGLPRLPDETRAAVADALRQGTLPQPEALGSLRGHGGTLMGAGGARSFHVVGPLATFVRADRPTFRWTPQPKARGYELAVFSEDLIKVASVRVAIGTEATLPSALERGRTYQWQVAAVTAEGRIVEPAPPEPEARFRVLATPESIALEGALAAAGDSDLAAGLLLAQAGVRDEAEARLARLVAANPGSVEARRLLESCRQRAGADDEHPLPGATKATQ